MDLADLRKKRKPFGKLAYHTRLKSVLNSKAAQKVAKNFANRLRNFAEKLWTGKVPPVTSDSAWHLNRTLRRSFLSTWTNNMTCVAPEPAGREYAPDSVS